MYDLRQLSALNGTLPTQQNPAGVTAQLVDLLAMQKVEEDKKAAARALAIAAGQANMPTVAQSMEQQALNSARGEIAQKLGLAGLAQQQAPQGPAPQMPPQQGLEGAPSPLPESYQEGGIVAFAGTTGSEVEDPAAKARARARADDRPYLGSLKTPPAPAAGDTSAADAALKAQIAAILASSGGGKAPVMSPEALAFEQRQIARIDSEQALDPEKFATEQEARYNERIGKNDLAAIENQKKRIAGIEALYARQAAERNPSWLTGLERMGENVHALPGQQFQGVSSAITKAREGYTTQDIANQVAINTLNEAMEKAIRENDLGAYNAAVSALEKARARIAEAGKQGTTVMDVNRRTQTQKEISHDNALARRQAAALSAVSHAQTAAGQSEYKAERLKLDQQRQQDQARANAELVVKAYMAKHPRAMDAQMGDQEAIAEMARDEAVYRVAAYKRNGIPLQMDDAAPAATTMSVPPPGAVRLKK